ncbi:MAG: YraN family protein [Coprobacter sp.]|nr:YraN family protein [Coprobacter sp.]
MAQHNETGKKGEQYAAEYLVKKGYVVRDVNWRSGHYELDIVAYKDNMLVVVEVKTRSSAEFMRPEEAVTPKKCRRIIDAADAYIHHYDLDFDVRFDVIALLSDHSGGYEIEHIPDAFYPTLR